ncbi:MAG TPA: hypothetical protein VGH73_16960 [Thermoanaerobaculia bacterium]
MKIATPEELAAYLAGGGPLAGCVFQGLDLTGCTDVLLAGPLAGAIFLGCLLAPPALAHAQDCGALIFPRIADIPYDPYKGSVYTVAELYAGFDPARPGSYATTLDARVYAHYRQTGGDNTPILKEALARRLHDHSVTNDLKALLSGQKVVAFMGGHDLSRTAPEFAGVAVAARELRRKGYLVVTGGGPGAMEAAHLGAWFAPRPDGELAQGLEILARAPLFSPVEDWLAAAFEVRARFPLAAVAEPWSIGIPTWVYGSEPPNAFATSIAKYFANSLREEGLLSIADHGVVFAPGSAGTIQEIFDDASQNHYKTFGRFGPMIFFGEGYWKWRKPVYPLLAQLAAGVEYGRWLAITDDPAEIVRLVERFAAAQVSGQNGA